MNWTAIEKLARKVIWDYHKGNSDQYLGLAWETHIKAQETFNGDQGCQYTTYYARCLRTALMHEYEYFGKGVVHIPVLKQKEMKPNVVSLSSPVSDTTLTFADVISAPAPPNDDLYDWIISTLATMYSGASPSLKRTIVAFRQHMHDETPIPRELRTHATNLRKTLNDMWVKYYCGE